MLYSGNRIKRGQISGEIYINKLFYSIAFVNKIMMLNGCATLWHWLVRWIEWNKGFAKYRYLASTTSSSISILITYIVFVTKMQKRQTLRNGFAFIRKRYHNFWIHFQNDGYIAETCNSALRTGMDDITGFLSL